MVSGAYACGDAPFGDGTAHRLSCASQSFGILFRKKPPVRLRTLLRDIKLRRGQLYSQTNYQESAGVINSLGLFSMSDFKFTPRDTTAACDTLDMTLSCVFDKPYDGSIEANYVIKSNDRTVRLVLGVTKRNAFRGGEKLSFSLKGSYEWQTGRRVSGGSSSAINSYEYGADVSIEYPRIEAPFRLYSRHRFYKPPSTLLSLSGNVLNRADYFKMLTVTAALTYKFQTSPNSRHELSPLLLDYNFLRNTTTTFDSIMTANPAIYVSMRNQFVPKIKYIYTYTSPSGYANQYSGMFPSPRQAIFCRFFTWRQERISTGRRRDFSEILLHSL